MYSLSLYKSWLVAVLFCRARLHIIPMFFACMSSGSNMETRLQHRSYVIKEPDLELVQKRLPVCPPLHLRKPFFSGLPIDHLPDGFYIGSLTVQILKLVRVLPHVDAQERYRAVHHGVLVFRLHKRQGSGGGIQDQPAPSTTLDAQQERFKLGFEFGHAAVCGLDCFAEFRCCLVGVREVAACRSKVLPEQRMVDVSACVELDALLQA